MSAQLYVDENTYLFELIDLTNVTTGEFINDATVEVTVYECDSDTEVDGTWPITLTASGSDGYYSESGTLDLDKEKYTVKMVITSGDNVSTASETVMARTRRF
jgi:hypothetical protein